VSRRKLALCVGINDYPHAPLQGCVNDALGWERLLAGEGYTGATMLDGQATKSTVTDALVTLIRNARFGDRIVFTYSGHGTWVPDVDRDEFDARDEALALHDYATGGLLLDDELHAIFAARRFGVRVTIFSDSCYSGTVARRVPLAGDTLARARYLDPGSFLDLWTPHRGAWPVEVLRRTLTLSAMEAEGAELAPPEKAKRTGTPLFSGCAENEVAYDAQLTDQWAGAFSTAALATYRPGITYRAWHAAIRTRLPTPRYNQSPQLQSSVWQRRWSL
jgi:hypothetical protein